MKELEIQFAHRSFKWSNLATKKAAVTCVIVGLGKPNTKAKRLVDGDLERTVEYIGPYLAPGVGTIVRSSERALSVDLEVMSFGNMALDGRNQRFLRLTRPERDELISASPGARRYVRPVLGSDELMKAKELWCIWVRPEEVSGAYAIPELRERFEGLKALRTSDDAGDDMRKASERPWSFREQRESSSHTIMVPGAASMDRYWLPVDVKGSEAIVSNLAFGIFDGAIWQAAILSSRMHRLWLETVGGRLKEDPRYSNTLVWNTFPLPKLSERRKEQLEEHWWEIDLTRKEAGLGRSLGDLYKPSDMPDPLRRAHEELDVTMETIFGSRRYRSDADRIEHILQLYERMIAQEAQDAEAAKADKPKRRRKAVSTSATTADLGETA